MLHASPTSRGTGVSIYGDYGDLESLYQAVHDIAISLDEENKYQKGQHQLLMNFAYEIRKGFSGQRLLQEMRFPGEEHTLQYYGFQLVWPDVLIFISALRHNAGYVQTNKLQQGSMYLLEHIVETALDSYDLAGASEIKNLITRGVPVGIEYAFIVYQAVHIEFVSSRSGKSRFRKIPQLLSSYFDTFSPEYRSLIASLSQSAKEQACEIADLAFSDFPEIKW